MRRGKLVCETNLWVVFCIVCMQCNSFEVQTTVQVHGGNNVMKSGDDPFNHGDVLLLESKGSRSGWNQWASSGRGNTTLRWSLRGRCWWLGRCSLCGSGLIVERRLGCSWCCYWLWTREYETRGPIIRFQRQWKHLAICQSLLLLLLSLWLSLWLMGYSEHPLKLSWKAMMVSKQ